MNLALRAVLPALPGALGLAAALARREVEARYKGSFGGLAWYVIQTLLAVAIYSWVFGSIFGARWAEAGREPTSFALALFLGLLVFNLFSECIQRAPGLVVGNANYVKKLVFPLEILPVAALGAALFNMGVGLALFLPIAALAGAPPGLAALWLPVVLAPLVVMLLGLMWLLASLGTFIRDIGHATGPALMLAMFLSPLFYPSAVLPAELRPVVAFNPVALPMEMARDAVLFGQSPDAALLGAYAAAAVAVCIAGRAWFGATRKGFADVL